MKRKNIFSILSNEYRQRIVRILSESPLTFTELARHLNISSSKLNYHLKRMDRVFISRQDNKYYLTRTGKAFLNLLRSVESPNVPEDQAKIASISIVIEPNRASFNAKKALKSIDFISHQGVDLVSFPFIHISKPIPFEKVTPPFFKKAKDLGAFISFGLFELLGDKKYYSTVLVEPDGNVEVYRSIHRNSIIGKADVGHRLVVADTKIGNIGLACGNELLYPELFRILKLRGADYVVCPTFGIQEKFRKIMQSILATRVIENQLIIALSSSGFFPNEPFAIAYSPYQEILVTGNVDKVSTINVDMVDVKKGREYFRQFFPRRVELYKELAKEEESKPSATRLFPLKKIIQRYKVNCENSVQLEERQIFGKPACMNVPMASYIRGSLPDVQKARDIRWFDDFGPLDGIIVEKEPIVKFLVPERVALMPGKSYSIGHRCKISEQISVKGAKIFLDLSFDFLNKFLSSYNNSLDEFKIELMVDSKFDLVASKPNYHGAAPSKEGNTLMWRWVKPKKIPALKITLMKPTPK